MGLCYDFFLKETAHANCKQSETSFSCKIHNSTRKICICTFGINFIVTLPVFCIFTCNLYCF